ncbi:MAG: LPS-assembly protein LptD [Chlorobi bacterium]|nr:LPS-assembly protein LptD [Chlorobiota bacterium]
MNVSKCTIGFATLLCTLFCSGLMPCSRPVSAEERDSQDTRQPGMLSGTISGAPISFSARDSLIYRFDRKSMELFGKARVERDSTTISAPKIVVDLESSILDAFGVPDGSGVSPDPAVFTNREGSFTSDKITYAFTTGRGETTNISSRSSQVIFSGRKVTRLENGELIVRDGTFTTCDDTEPHYWVSTDYMKIIPGSRIIARPFIMYIRPELFSRRLPAIPLIPLPFMVFPLREGRDSGLLIPRFSHDSDRGYYFSDLGYFWAINDYLDLRIEGDIAFNGSWRLGERFRYKSRDAFSGFVEGEYERYFKGDADEADYARYSSWSMRFGHHQDFSPAATLDLNLQFQGGDRNYDLNTINNETVVNEQALSYSSFGKTFDDENSILTAGYQRNDDLRSSDLYQLAGIGFYQNRYYPFRKGRLGTLDDWRDRVSLTSSASLQASIASDSGNDLSQYLADADLQVGYFHEFSENSKALFTQGVFFQGSMLDDDSYGDRRYGMRLQLPLRVQSTLFRHFNVNAGFSFNHYLVGNDVLNTWDGAGVVTTERNEDTGFSTWNFSADVSTRLYASMKTPLLEGLTGLKALRHTLIPTLSYTFNPDFTDTGYDYYRTVYDGSGYLRYSRFEHSVYQDIPEGQSTIGISLKNLFHGKIRTSTEEAGNGERTVHLLSLTASTAYNFAADAFRWSPLLVTASSSALSPNFLLSAGALYDFYGYDSVTGERVNRFYAEDGNGFLRFVSGYLNMSLNLEGKKRNGDSGRPQALRAEQAIFRERFNAGDFSDIDYSLPWRLRLSLYLLSDRTNPLEEAETTALLNLSAKVALSSNWQAGVNTGYDIEQNKFVFPMLQLYRDLHCWQVGLQWVPTGEYNSYYLQIGLKAPQLKDIRFSTGGNTGGWTQ